MNVEVSFLSCSILLNYLVFIGGFIFSKISVSSVAEISLALNSFLPKNK